MTTPEVSVIIPAYNAGRWLADAVNSVLAQTFGDWEVIIVNDGSTDNTSEIARNFADSRIRVIDQANAGVSAARNAGLDAALGSFITFLDADDALLPACLSMKLEGLKQAGTDWAFTDVALCDAALQPSGQILVGTDDDVLQTLLLQEKPSVPISCGNIVARRHCFEQGVRFDEQLSNAADQDFTMQLASRFSSIHIAGAYTLYRNVPNSMSKNIHVYQADHLYLFGKARAQHLLDDRRFRHRCMANVYWAIGGSWWLQAKKRLRAFPWFLRAVLLYPPVLIRPIRKRLTRRSAARF